MQAILHHRRHPAQPARQAADEVLDQTRRSHVDEPAAGGLPDLSDPDVMAVARYLADTSVWARLTHPAVRYGVAPRADRGLIGTCPVIDVEILYSARTSGEHDHFRSQRAAFEYFPLTDEIAQRAIEVQGLLAMRSRHRSVSIPDLLIAATAERYSLTVLHYDGDYERIAQLTGQPVEWVVPAGAGD